LSFLVVRFRRILARILDAWLRAEMEKPAWILDQLKYQLVTRRNFFCALRHRAALCAQLFEEPVDKITNPIRHGFNPQHS
tara:strand:+ start:1993 stop:2232 length:240 start_codon:yes stop_codon:yes gene_type:complete